MSDQIIIRLSHPLPLILNHNLGSRSQVMFFKNSFFSWQWWRWRRRSVSLKCILKKENPTRARNAILDIIFSTCLFVYFARLKFRAWLKGCAHDGGNRVNVTTLEPHLTRNSSFVWFFSFKSTTIDGMFYASAKGLTASHQSNKYTACHHLNCFALNWRC